MRVEQISTGICTRDSSSSLHCYQTADDVANFNEDLNIAIMVSRNASYCWINCIARSENHAKCNYTDV